MRPYAHNNAGSMRGHSTRPMTAFAGPPRRPARRCTASGLVCCERHPDAEVMHLFLPFVQPAGLEASWRLERGLLRDVAAGAHDATPGTDGLSYSFWAHDPDCCLDALDDIADAPQLYPPPPPPPSGTTLVQKCRADTRRPFTMITTGETLLALQVNYVLTPVAAGTVASPQRGVVLNRNIADDIVRLDGEMAAMPLLPGCRAAAVLFDFAHAFSALCHGWITGVELPLHLIAIIRMVCHDLCTDFVYAGVVVTTISLHSGIRQGCPLSGTIFALSLDPFLRLYLSGSVLNGMHRFLHADTFANTMRGAYRHLPLILRALHQCCLASGLA